MGRIKRQQRKVSRAKRGSGLRRKKTRILANLYRREQVRNHNMVHRFTSQLVRRYDVIAIEDLNIRGMVKSAKGTLTDLVLQPQIREAAFVVALPGAGLVTPSPTRPGQDEFRHLGFRPYQASEKSAHLRDSQGYQLFIQTVVAPFSPCSVA